MEHVTSFPGKQKKKNKQEKKKKISEKPLSWVETF